MSDRELLKRWQDHHDDPSLRSTLRPEIRDSWERSYAYGVDRYLRENPYICTRAELDNYRDKAGPLLETSGSIMASLIEFISGTGFVVVLADSNLCVIKVVGDHEALNYAKKAHLLEGALWSEELVGTNAAALAIALAKPVSVSGYEHFCLFSHTASCSVAPIIDQGRVYGALGMIAPYSRAPFNNFSNYTLGMIVAASKHIKYKMAIGRAIRYHEILTDSIQEGLFAIDVNSNITFMNDNCAKSFNIKRDTVIGRSIYEFLGNNTDNQYFLNKITSGRKTVDENFSLTVGRETLHCNVTCNPLQNANQDEGAVIVIRETQRIKGLVRNIIGNGAKMTFSDIVGKDPEFLRSIRTASAAASSLSNVLLLGESGTGKDILAQAMHNASPRKNGPYLAINCAAIPRELIASELFGYEEGAFTGARKGGNIGKFEIADQGAIFLDEIGDMPLDLQTSLLRVLEEKTIMRLGGSKQIPVNVRIIAATNQDLEAMIESNRFRRDLYYRLGVIRISIPPLRERREDILLLAEHFTEKICRRLDKPPVTLAPEVAKAFVNYAWPGNIREMQNVLEGAIEMASDNIITYDLVNNCMMQKNFVTEEKPEKDHAVHDLGKQTILDYLEKFKYNKTRVAHALGISRRTLYRRLDEYRIVI